MNQRQLVLDYIQRHGSITAIQADDDLGIRRLAARVKDLKDDGHDIQSERVTVKNRRGEDCTVARYSLGGTLTLTPTVAQAPASPGLLFDMPVDPTAANYGRATR